MRLICVLLACSIAQARYLGRQPYKVQLQPFQIVYITTAKGGGNSADFNDKIKILEATRNHLIKTEFGNQTSFKHLFLYQNVRSDDKDMFSNGTHVAFTGSALYSDDGMTRDMMQTMEYMCFLAENERVYVQSLQQMGWRNLDRALLMTVAGDMVEFQNGTMVEMTEDLSETSEFTDMMMDSETSRMLYMAAFFIPIGLILFAFILFCWCSLRNNTKCWKVRSENPAWQANASKAGQLRRFSFEFADDTASNASGLTEDSVRVAVASKKLKESASPKSRYR